MNTRDPDAAPPRGVLPLCVALPQRHPLPRLDIQMTCPAPFSVGKGFFSGRPPNPSCPSGQSSEHAFSQKTPFHHKGTLRPRVSARPSPSQSDTTLPKISTPSPPIEPIFKKTIQMYTFLLEPLPEIGILLMCSLTQNTQLWYPIRPPTSSPLKKAGGRAPVGTGRRTVPEISGNMPLRGAVQRPAPTSSTGR